MMDVGRIVNTFTEDEMEIAYHMASHLQMIEKDSENMIHFLLYQTELMEVKIQRLIACLEEVSK